MTEAIGMFQLVVFSSYVFGFLSVWLVVFITLENYIRICHPFSVARFCTVQKVRLDFPLIVQKIRADKTSPRLYFFTVQIVKAVVTAHRELTFSWWGSYGLCPRYKPTELAHSSLFCCRVCFCLVTLSTVFNSMNSPDNSPLSHSDLLVLFCLIGPLNYISLSESLPQP